jgi:hypothetical protein
MTWQIAAAFAVPVLGFLGALLSGNREPGGYRRLKHAADALAAVPAGSSAATALEELVEAHANALREQEAARQARHLNIFNLVMSIVLGVLGAFAGFCLWTWSAGVWGSPWGWVIFALAIVLGLCIVLLVAAAFGTIYNSPATKKTK